MILIHYGDDRFHPDKFESIKNCNFVKPRGGLWASPKDSPFGWKYWCQNEDFHTEELKDSFRFTLDKKAKILTIDSLKRFLLVNIAYAQAEIVFGHIYLDFEKIAKKYDAIYLTWKGQCETRYSYPTGLYGWDCESILILKPNYIHEL